MGQTPMAYFYNMNQTHPFDPQTQSWHFPPQSGTIQTNLELNICSQCVKLMILVLSLNASKGGRKCLLMIKLWERQNDHDRVSPKYSV